MKKIMISMCLSVFLTLSLQAQNIVKGIVKDYNSETPLQNIFVQLEKTNVKTTTDSNGYFLLEQPINGNYILNLQLKGYQTQRFPIEFSGKVIDLGIILLQEDFSEDVDISVITITDDELNNDENSADNITGLLQASRDTYLRTAAFDFSSSFYKVRGLDSENGTVLINGIEMNTLLNGRPQWSNWGGLNDATRNQEFNNHLNPSNYTFGGVLGSTNINIRASEQYSGTKISYASSNRSYSHRMLATYSSGALKNNWSYTFSASRRIGLEGFNDATFYKGSSFLTSISKGINDQHNLNFSFIYAPNKRGKSSPNTQEVYDLKGIQYNEYWGYINGDKRNSRAKTVDEPIIILNHDWKINEKSSLNTNIGYQFGKIGNSRLEYTFAANPSPTYYQKLPSYFLARGQLDDAYEAEQNFITNGQIDWERIYDANKTNATQNLTAAYIISEDRNDHSRFTANTIFSSNLSKHITLNSKIEFKKVTSQNYARVQDLLGGTGYLDFDKFGSSVNEQQNDLQNPNRIVSIHDRFKYNYNINSLVLNGFLQTQFTYHKIDFFFAGNISKITHQREGLFENGSYPGLASLGKSEKSSFTNFSFKTGGTYKINGRNFINSNLGYFNKVPNIRNTFANVRDNNNLVQNLQSEKNIITDLSYMYRGPMITAKLSGFYSKIKDATEISFFYADGISGNGNDDNAFVQEILTHIDKQYIGFEFGLEAQVTSTIKLKTAGNIGQYNYANNPNLQLTSDAFDDKNLTSNLNGYKLASGPQTAYSFGFEYRDPDYWWFGATANIFQNTYIDIAPLIRTENFSLDTDGLPFNDYDPIIARKLLQQEEFDDYFTINLILGKSWKIGDYYLGAFASISNILGTEYKTGGFEQGRNANYRTLRNDTENPKPVFGSKYWYGRGATYFLNVYFRL